ncbi:MAG: slipin family protein [Candidatus Taylorbacteria bacterium]|nr:slipin family protein [Candidatus Taylorbacteria bacterium]
MWYIILVAIFFLVISSVRQVNQYERGVKFTFGKFTSIMEPGWRIVWPIIQGFQKVDVRTKAVDVSVRVNAVIYYKVSDANKEIIEVEDFRYAISQYAQTTMRNIVGEVTLDELLSSRDKIADRIREIVDKETDAWGLKVQNVDLKDVSLPAEMERTIGKQAEAEREKRAVIINSQGELAASENIAKAAEMLAKTPGALHLRTLQSINDMSSDQSNTVVYMVPVEALKALEGFIKK